MPVYLIAVLTMDHGGASATICAIYSEAACRLFFTVSGLRSPVALALYSRDRLRVVDVLDSSLLLH